MVLLGNLLSSISYAQNKIDEVVVSATVSEHLTFSKDKDNISTQTNLKKNILITNQSGVSFITLEL
jgi:hypothetical protein